LIWEIFQCEDLEILDLHPLHILFLFSGALKIDEDWAGDMAEEEEEEEDSEGREVDYSNMLAVDITEQVPVHSLTKYRYSVNYQYSYAFLLAEPVQGWIRNFAKI
jgi:hypothetical protein